MINVWIPKAHIRGCLLTEFSHIFMSDLKLSSISYIFQVAHNILLQYRFIPPISLYNTTISLYITYIIYTISQYHFIPLISLYNTTTSLYTPYIIYTISQHHFIPLISFIQHHNITLYPLYHLYNITTSLYVWVNVFSLSLALLFHCVSTAIRLQH